MTDSTEKSSIDVKFSHVDEKVADDEIPQDSNDVSPEEAKRIMWKIDRRLIVVTGLCYCISLLDRGNLGVALVAGMREDLGLGIGTRYSLVVLIFFVPYIIFEFPAPVVIRKLGPRYFISFMTFTWGVILIGMGFVQSWEAMLGLRIILGALEAGFFPGSLYLLSTWYVRYDVHKRFSAFYFFGTLASAVSGILGFAFSQMEGVAGIRGWRWIFIMEGILSCVIAFIGFLFLVDFPEKANLTWHFLDERETKWVVDRVNADRGDVIPEKYQTSQFVRQALDLKLWCFGMLFFCLLCTSYAIAYFLPTILGSMGFDRGESQYLTAPPYVAGAGLMVLTAWVGDKYHIRGPLIIANCVITIIGLVVMAFPKGNAVRYFGVFLTVMGTSANIPTIMAYQANNIVGQWKRAMSSAIFVGMGGIGGIAGALVFRSQDAPQYRPGIIACLACNGLMLVIVAGLSIHFVIQNRLQKDGRRVLEGMEGFRFTL